MESALVSVGTGVMKPLLSKLYTLLKEEHSRLKGVWRQVEDTKDEMSSMEAALEVLADAEQLKPHMRSWRDDVRELSYDMDDCVDDFLARVGHKHDGPTRLKGFFHKLKNLKPRHEIAGEIKELKARAIEASERHTRYKIDRLSQESTFCDIDPRMHTLYVEVGKLVGIDDPKKNIIEWFENEDSSTQLRVVSIVGPGGLGKTTLGNVVFQTIKGKFPCNAFVSVSRKPNMKNVLRDIAERVGIKENTTNDDEKRLIDRLRSHLQDKKYLIVIDDIWSTEAWKSIRDALLNNDHGSRIITTTRNITVASFCSSQGDYVYRMEPLSFADSRRLFLERAFRSEDLFPPSLKEVSEKILEKCAGLPLAIITMSSLLSDQTAEEVWKRALAAIGSSLAMEPEAGDMSKILSLSYFDLPHALRTCLLYLSSYPEDQKIPKNCLIHKWIAEGFIQEGHGRSMYEVGEGYFYELINRSLIEPANMWRGQVEACQVHDIILDFITCKAKEENFMTAFGDVAQGKKYKVRRLFVVSRNMEMATVPGDLSHVRSLSVLGCFKQNSLLDFPALRVLDLGGCDDLKNHHLANIEKLLLLKYLRVGSTSVTELPGGIGELKYLETLDIRGTWVSKLPSSTTRLERLARLYVDLEPFCLSDGILGQLQSLEELEKLEVKENELGKFLQELGKLTKLRKLSVTLQPNHESMAGADVVSFVGTLISSYNINQLSISYGAYHGRCDALSLETWCPANPAALRMISLGYFHIDKVPGWMTSLVNLTRLNLLMYRMAPQDMEFLGRIPALAFLKLDTWYGRSGRIFIHGFRSLKHFELEVRCCGTAVEFKEGSMPKLEHLRLEFCAHKMECVNYAYDFGIQHLSALTNVYIIIDGDNDIIYRLVQTALGKLPNHPTISLIRCGSESDDCKYFLKQEWVKENGKVAHCSFLDQLVEEINEDALPRLRVLGMLSSLEDLVKSLCATAPPAVSESAAVARVLYEIQCEISTTDAGTKATASHHIAAITRHLLASPAAAAAAPNDLFIHLVQDLVPHLAYGSTSALDEAKHILAACPSTAVSVHFKLLAACLASPDPRASTVAVDAFWKLSASPADATSFLPLVPDLCNVLTTSRSAQALKDVLKVLARLAPLESSLAARILDPVCQLLSCTSNISLAFECIRTVLIALPAHGAAMSLAIGKYKELLTAAHDPNLSLLALGILAPGYDVHARSCRIAIAKSLGDAHPNIRSEALHLLMGTMDRDNVMGIASTLVFQVDKADPEFANEIIGAVLAECCRNEYQVVMNFDWYVGLLGCVLRTLNCAQGHEIARQLVIVGLGVQDARPRLVRLARTLLINSDLLGNHLFFPILSAAAWISGEYVELTKNPAELVEALLQPRTSLLPMSVRAVYIQTVHKVITFCCNFYLERSSDLNKELDVVLNGLAIDQTVSGGNKAEIIGFGAEQIVEKDHFSRKSILQVINLIEATVGPLVDCNEVEVLERAHNLIGFVHLIKDTQEFSDHDDKHRGAKELVKNMQIVLSQELSPVYGNAQSHPDSISMPSSRRSGHSQTEYMQRQRYIAQSDAVPRAPCRFETNTRESYTSAGTLSYFGDTQRFESAFKMKRRTFNYICCLVKPVKDISSCTFFDGRVLLLEDHVAIALRMFMSGGPVDTVLSEVGVSRSTLGLIFWRFLGAMLKQASHQLCWPHSIKMESIKSKFELIHGMPNCCGVLDTTYITTTPLPEPNFDNEKNHRIMVQAVVDPDTRITDFWVDYSGMQNQSSILHSSDLFKRCEKGLWPNGKLKLLDGSEVGEYIIADAQYPLLPWLLTPYQEKDLSYPKVEFNRRHSAARTVTQRGLARLKDTWKWMRECGSLGSFREEMLFHSVNIIHVCCLLHNIVIDMEGAQEHIPNNHDMSYRQQVCQLLADANAVRVRDVLSQHLANRTSKFGGTFCFLEDEQRFESFFQMKRRTFNYICCLVKSTEDVSCYTFLDGRLMCSEDQVAVALRMLMSGGPVETIGSDVGVDGPTVTRVTGRFLEAMMKRAGYHLRWPDSIEMEKIKSKFDMIHGLPHCCGVLDTTYIPSIPLSSAEPNCDYDKNYSMAVQVVIDSDMRFIELSVREGGSTDQWSILKDSFLFEECEKGHILNGSKLKLSDGWEIGEYIIGDAGYPLFPWLLTPYQESNLLDPKIEFNGRHSAARTVALRALARLNDTWKCVHLAMWHLEIPCKFDDIIKVCALLHNIVIEMEGAATEEERISDNYSYDRNHGQQLCQSTDEDAVTVRDILSMHLSSKSGGNEVEQEASRRKAEEERHRKDIVHST